MTPAQLDQEIADLRARVAAGQLDAGAAAGRLRGLELRRERLDSISVANDQLEGARELAAQLRRRRARRAR